MKRGPFFCRIYPCSNTHKAGYKAPLSCTICMKLKKVLPCCLGNIAFLPE